MFEALLFSWLLLPLGFVLGWYLARRSGDPRSGVAADAPRGREYLSGLSHLVNEDPDQAIAALVKAVELDPGTVELHLTLGSLFRKRGEVDRALRLHESLLSRSSLSPAQRQQTQFELAQDYLKAGVMDRAEAIFRELAGRGLFMVACLEHLLAIHEQAREWEKAIEVARRLEPVKGQSQRALIAQYHCELADASKAAGNGADALRLAAQALSEDPACVRASLLQGALLEVGQDFTAALKAYRRVPEQDARFLAEVLPAIERCYRAVGDKNGFQAFLDQTEARWPQPSPMLFKARLMLESGTDPTVYLTERLQSLPNWRGLDLLFEALARQSEALAPTIDGLRAALRKTYEAAPPYQCAQCGLMPRLLFWQCPSCKRWGTVVPSQSLIRA